MDDNTNSLETLARNLTQRGLRLGLAGFRTDTRNMLDRAGALAVIGMDAVYPTLKAAMSAFLDVSSPTPDGGSEVGDAPVDAAGDHV